MSADRTYLDAGAELREVWKARPREGTARERQAWRNGFREAVEAIDAANGTRLALDVLGVSGHLHDGDGSWDG